MNTQNNQPEKKNVFQRFLLILILASLFTTVIFMMIYSSSANLKTFAAFFLTSLSYALPIGLANGYANEILDKRYSWVTETNKRLIWGIIVTVLINVLVVFGRNYVDFVLIQKASVDEFFGDRTLKYSFMVLGVALFISLFLHARGFMMEWKNSAKKQVTEQKIIAKSADAKFESLKNQLDPHFLFNSLNVLSSLIEENPKQAERFTDSMSKIYRYVLDQKDKELVTVNEELDFAKTYGELLKTRFEDSVNFEFDVEDSVKNLFVVPLSLQLLLENAIKHNFATSNRPLNIKISSSDGFLIIENNLQRREQNNERKGIGLSNIVQRYALVSDKNVSITESENTFKIKIPILTEKQIVMNTTQLSNEQLAYAKAKDRMKELKSFYGNLIAYCIVIPYLFYVNWNSGGNKWWAFWPMIGWGIGVAIHAFRTFGIGKDWEEKKINELMKKYENHAN